MDPCGIHQLLIGIHAGLPWIHVGAISSLLGSMWAPYENVMDPLKLQGDEVGSTSTPEGKYVGSPWIHVGSISSLLESM